MAVDCVWPLAATLGEGPLWNVPEGALWFTDIKGRALHRFYPGSGRRDTFPVDGEPGFRPRTWRRLCDGHGRSPGALRRRARGGHARTIAMDPRNRLNDATVDARGRLWFGSTDDGCVAPTGAVHVIGGSAGTQVRVAGGECAITNGPAVSADGRTLYHVDSAARTITAFDVSARDTLVDGRLFAAFRPDEGTPDGVVIDAEGCLWVALWGGWAVRRYAPDGELLLTVPMPCAQPTKVAFGGDQLRTAYVTTATIGLDDTDRARQPLAGGLFAFEAPAPGLPPQAAAI